MRLGIWWRFPAGKKPLVVQDDLNKANLGVQMTGKSPPQTFFRFVSLLSVENPVKIVNEIRQYKLHQFESLVSTDV